MDRQDFAGGLELFKQYTMDKFRGIESSGLPRGRFDPFSTGVVGVQWIRPLVDPRQKNDIVKQAQEMMKGLITVNGKTLAIGAPGTVNWKAITASANRNASGWPWDFDAFYPLLSAYILTGEQPYMDKWAAYVDDWALNSECNFSCQEQTCCPRELRFAPGTLRVPRYAASCGVSTQNRMNRRDTATMLAISLLSSRAKQNRHS